MNDITFADIPEYLKSRTSSEFHVDDPMEHLNVSYYVRDNNIIEIFVSTTCSIRLIYDAEARCDDEVTWIYHSVSIYELTDFTVSDRYVYRLTLPAATPINSDFHWETALSCGNDIKRALMSLVTIKDADKSDDVDQNTVVDIGMVVSNIMHLSGSLDLINDVYHRQTGGQLSIDIDTEKRIKIICDGIDIELKKLYAWVHQAEIDMVDAHAIKDAASATVEKLKIYRHESNAAIFIYNQYLDIFG